MAKRKVLLIVAEVALIVIGAAVLLLLSNKPDNGPPKDLILAKSSAGFPLYYPSKLPEGFQYKDKSLTNSGGVVIYTITFSKTKKLFVSTQPKPKEVDFNDFYTRVLKNKADVFSTEGKATIGQLDNQVAGSLVNDKVWVLLNSPDGIDGQAMTQVVSNLKPI